MLTRHTGAIHQNTRSALILGQTRLIKMAATVADLPPKRLSELAGYLKEFSPDHPDDEEGSRQYWEMIAETLRNDLPTKFSSYTEVRLADMNEHRFLHDLAQRKFPLTTLKRYLERIKCRPALNIFEDAIPPIIKHQPAKNIEVIEGHPIALEVEAECRPGQPIYQWFKGRVPITGQTKSTFLIKNAAVANSGYYTCRITNPLINDPKKAAVFSEYAMVTVVGKREVPSSNPRIAQATEHGDHPDSVQVSTPKIVRHPSPVSVDMNQKIELECVAEGAFVYDWYKNKMLLNAVGTKGKLLIEKAAPSDSGTYHCVAISKEGGKATSLSAKVTVAIGITITKQPDKIMVVHKDQKFQLYCKATNQYGKKMKYEWFHGDSLIAEGEEFIGYAAASRDIELKFICRVSLEGNSNLSVNSRIAKVKVKTVWITEEPKNIKGVIGSPAVLHCKAEGLGPITYTWFKSDTAGEKPKPIFHSAREWFVINSLAQKHWGYYICHAENEYESAVSRRVHISAHLPTAATLSRRKRPMQPLIKILRQPWSHVVPKGGQFRLLCEAVNSGDEPLQYQWYFSGQPIIGATDSKFIRENIDESAYGSYWCFVNTSSNSAVEISNTARIEQSHGTPSPVAVPKGRNLARLEAETELMTMKEERYAREKVALLIGNQRYEAKELEDLKSPEGDIRELSRELETLNFKVISLVNLRHSEIMKALEVFYKMLAVPGIYALFYYSGHGFRTPEGRNYLVPVDAERPLRLGHNIHVDGIIQQMQQKLSRAIVILDCCRTVVPNHIPDEPFSSLDSLPSGVENISNYVEISSCVDNFSAGDSHGEAALNSPTTGFPKSDHSFFNKALRNALSIKGLSILSINQHILTKFREEGLDQRTQYRGSFADDKITLHDAVMMDDPQGHEDLLNKVLATYEQAHSAPKPVVLRGEDLGEVANLARLEVEFKNDFSNVLNVVTKLILLQNDTTVTAKIDYDLDFLNAQGVIAEQGGCLTPSAEGQLEEEEEEEGGQGEYEPFSVTTLRVFNIQRLRSKQQKLKFVLTATVQVEGRDKVGKVSYEVPLATHVLNSND